MIKKVYGSLQTFRNRDLSFKEGVLVLVHSTRDAKLEFRAWMEGEDTFLQLVKVRGYYKIDFHKFPVRGAFTWGEIEDLLSRRNLDAVCETIPIEDVEEFRALAPVLLSRDQWERRLSDLWQRKAKGLARENNVIHLATWRKSK